MRVLRSIGKIKKNKKRVLINSQNKLPNVKVLLNLKASTQQLAQTLCVEHALHTEGGSTFLVVSSWMPGKD